MWHPLLVEATGKSMVVVTTIVPWTCHACGARFAEAAGGICSVCRRVTCPACLFSGWTFRTAKRGQCRVCRLSMWQAEYSRAPHDDRMTSPRHWTLREARAQYLRENGLGEDGGYGPRWVRIKIGPVPIVFPNTNGRRAALLPHDLHHVATGYDTTLAGEAEIGAWELGSGCRHYYAAWILNLGAVSIGLFLAPRRVVRAFWRGLRCTNLYHLGVDAGWSEETVGGLRERLRLEEPQERPSAGST